MKELKPCPFCGSPAELRERENMNPQGGKQYNVRCSNPSCICKPLAWRRDRIEIMTLWNIRVKNARRVSNEKMAQSSR